MERERYRRRASIAEEFDTSLMYDDIEKIREREEEEEKDQNSKLGSAGLMALVAGAGLLVASFFTNFEFMEIISVILPVIGFGALGYGLVKTIQLAFRQKELNFPALNVYRKTRPAASTTSSAEEGTKERARTYRSRYAERNEQNQYRYSRRSTTKAYDRARTDKKVLQRSRKDRVFSGVAGGIAKYTGVSSALIRFAFIFSIPVTSGMSIFLYLLLSIILPANYDDRFEQRFPYGEGDSNQTA